MRDIIAFRNVLIHGYAGIEHRRVWDIAQSALPGRERSLPNCLKNLGDNAPYIGPCHFCHAIRGVLALPYGGHAAAGLGV